jgi:hypothetical protein
VSSAVLTQGVLGREGWSSPHDSLCEAAEGPPPPRGPTCMPAPSPRAGTHWGGGVGWRLGCGGRGGRKRFASPLASSYLRGGLQSVQFDSRPLSFPRGGRKRFASPLASSYLRGGLQSVQFDSRPLSFPQSVQFDSRPLSFPFLSLFFPQGWATKCTIRLPTPFFPPFPDSRPLSFPSDPFLSLSFRRLPTPFFPSHFFP